MRSMLTALAMAALLWAQMATGQASVELIENLDQGRINWSRGIIQASGRYLPTACSTSGSLSPEDALRVVRAEAAARTLATAMALRIDAKTTVSDFVAGSGVYLAKIKELIEAAEMVQHINPQDGSVEVILSLGIYGSFSQLVLPREIKQVESIKPVPSPAEASEPPGASFPAAPRPDAGPYTGLIVDARGIGVLPSMVPQILDERGDEVFGSAFVSREVAVQYGLAGFTRSMQAARKDKRIDGQSLIVKGLKVHPSGCCNIIISNADAAKIRSTYAHLTFLRQCRVIIVVD